MIWNGLKYIAGIDILPIKFSSRDYFINKVYLMPFMILNGFSFLMFYTQKRAIVIVSKYPKDYKVITFKNIVLVFLIMIVPLIIGVQFLNSHK